MAKTESARRRIIYAVFVLTVIWGLYNQPWNRRRGGTEQIIGSLPAVVHSMAVHDNSVSTMRSGTVREWKIDPFRTFGDPEEGAYTPRSEVNHAAPNLQGTMIVAGRHLCVVDGRTYRVGEQLRDWMIVKIGQGEVLLQGPAGQSVQLVVADRETGD